MTRMLIVTLVAATMVLAPSVGWADDQESPRNDGLSLTISPLHLILPVGELTLEIPLGEQRKMGVAIVGGYGSVQLTSSDDDVEETSRLGVYELGASWRYYLLGNYSFGMQLGAELLYVGISGTIDDTVAVADGLSGAPFVGFKVVTLSGFTFDSQLGVAYSFVRAEADDGTRAESSDVFPLLNLNIGWTF